MNYSYKFSDDSEKSKESHPFYGKDDPNNTIDYLQVNMLTKILVEMILMDYKELEKHNHEPISIEQFKRDLLHATEHLWG